MIYVIDAMCGSGKSTAILAKIRENPDKKWLYITPFLSEVEERIPAALPDMDFYVPKLNGVHGRTKLEDMRKLLKEGKNIASTHALFRLFDKEIIELVLDAGYILVIDESVDAITEFKEGLNRADVHALLTGDFVSKLPDERDRLVWNEDKYPEHDGKYLDVRKMCDNRMLYSYNDTFLMCEFPPELLANIEQCFVLTYMFKASSMRYWLQVNGIDYKSVDNSQLGLRSERELKALIKANLEVVSNRTLDKIHVRQRDGTCSASWFKNASAATLRKYRGIIRSHIVQHSVKKEEVFWTTYKEFASRLSGAGYKSCHLPLNLRATNEYKNKNFCVYACNPYPNVTDGNYINSLGVEIEGKDADIFTLSNFLQFIFRGCIRDHKPMKVLIMSRRVKELLEEWLDSE